MAPSLLTVNGQNSVTNRLRRSDCAEHSLPVAAKSATGRSNLCNPTATPDAFSVFFYCRSLSTPLFSGIVPHRINGGSGGAAFGLADIRWRRYCYPGLGYPPFKSVATLVVANTAIQRRLTHVNHLYPDAPAIYLAVSGRAPF